MAENDELSHHDLDDLLEELRARTDAKSDELRESHDAEIAGPRDSLGGVDTASLVEAVKDNQKVIYGVDDRKDLFEISDPALLRDADCVVSLFRAGSIDDNNDGTSTLRTVNFGASRNLCSGEAFREQPSGAFCSGFLVSRDIVATAGHCIDVGSVDQTRFVFGFMMIDSATAQTTISNGEIYSGVAIVGRVLDTSGADWALVRLDRGVTNHVIPNVRTSGRIPRNQAVHVIGHPSGLPIKVAGGANVRDNSPKTFFVANLDTYGGNSGSPVFNSDTHQVEGILVRGERDFVSADGCMVSLVCPTTGCRGEDCTRTTELRLNDLVFAAEGSVTLLRVHDVGTRYGPRHDQINVEVVIQLDSERGRSFGFQLRTGSDENAQRRMLDVLRDAFNHDRRVRIDYQWSGTGTNNGRLFRVARIS
jgi:hypothetical protein